MSEELPPVLCDDPSTWRHKGEKIDLPRLLELIEENGGAKGLDLHGAHLSGLHASPEDLRPYKAQFGGMAPGSAILVDTGQSGSLRLGRVVGINLEGAHLEHAELLQANLQHALLANAILDDCIAVGARLEKANLTSASLRRADLSGARLQEAIIWRANLYRAILLDTRLDAATLRGASLRAATLLGAHLQHLNLYDTDLSAAFLYGAHLDRTNVRRECLGPGPGEELAAKGRLTPFLPGQASFHDAREVYLSLKANFSTIGRYEDAAWAAFKEGQMEKATSFPTTVGHYWIRRKLRRAMPRQLPRRRLSLRRFLVRRLMLPLAWAWLHIRLFLNLCPREATYDWRGKENVSRWRWARNWAYELLTGYGERPWNPVIIAAASMAAFAAGYWATTAVRGFWDAVAYSIATFATFNLARPATQPQGLGVEIASAAQAMLGISLFALFVFTLSNRMRRS